MLGGRALAAWWRQAFRVAGHLGTQHPPALQLLTARCTYVLLGSTVLAAGLQAGWRAKVACEETEQESLESHEKREVRNAVLAGSWPSVEGWARRHGVDAPLTEMGQTALSFAAEHGAIFLVQSLLSISADPRRGDRHGLSPLHLASRRGHTPVVALLLQAGVEPDRPTDVFGNTPLHGAVGFGHVAVAELLLEAGVDPNSRTADVRAPPSYGAWSLHETPLHLACKEKPPHLEAQSRPLVLLLLRYGGLPHLQDDCGDTAAHLLVRKGDAATLWSLLSWSPPFAARDAVRLRNQQGLSAAEEAAASSRPALYQLMMRLAPAVASFRSFFNIEVLKVTADPKDCDKPQEWAKYQERLNRASEATKS